MRNDFCSDYLEHSAKGTSWEKTEHKYVERRRGKDGKWIYRYTIDSPAAENEGMAYNYHQPMKALRELKSKSAAMKGNYREAEYQGRKAAEEQASRMRGEPFAGYQNSAEYNFTRTSQYKKELIEEGKEVIRKLLRL